MLDLRKIRYFFISSEFVKDSNLFSAFVAATKRKLRKSYSVKIKKGISCFEVDAKIRRIVAREDLKLSGYQSSKL
jgi:hypothetical protein